MTEVSGATGHQESSLASLIYSTSAGSLPRSHLDLVDPTSSSHAYLLSLTSRSLVDLRSQPAALSTAKSSLNSQLSSLCSQHVASFVQVHHATSLLPSSLNSLDSVLQTLIERDLPDLSEAAQRFTEEVKAPLKAKVDAQNLISQYELSLKDLLDIPRLLMTCVRANHPVEALQLASHMMKIGSQGQHSGVITSLRQECLTSLRRLREDLLRGLGSRGLRLPAARRYVSLLRKFKDVDEARRGGDNIEHMGDCLEERLTLSDSTICLSFLRSRTALLGELDNKEGASKSVSAFTSYLSAWRDLVGDSCGMAQSLFTVGKHELLDSSEDELNPGILVSAFAHQAILALRSLMATSIPHLLKQCSTLQHEIEILEEINTEMTFSAASLSRHGLDISFLRPLEAEETRRRQLAEEDTRRKREAEEDAMRKEEEAAEAQRVKEEEEIRRRKEEEEAIRKRQEEEALHVKSMQEEEARRRKVRENEAKKKREEEEIKRKQEEELQRRSKAEEADKLQRLEAEEAERQKREVEEEDRRREVLAKEDHQRKAAEEERKGDDAGEEAHARHKAEQDAERKAEGEKGVKGDPEKEVESDARHEQEVERKIEAASLRKQKETPREDAAQEQEAEKEAEAEPDRQAEGYAKQAEGGAAQESLLKAVVDVAEETRIEEEQDEGEKQEEAEEEKKVVPLTDGDKPALEELSSANRPQDTPHTSSQQSQSGNKLAEKLRLRQEERERAAKAASTAQ